MTTQEIERKVKVAIELQDVIRKAKAEGLIKKSYNPVLDSAANSAMRLATKPEKAPE